MPDTTGTVANLAEYRGQTLTLDPADQKNYTKMHLFGTTADGTGTGTYTFKYETGADTTASVTFPDWCGTVTPPAHIAIGPLSGRYTPTGSDTARCSIYHVEVTNPAPTRKLVSVVLPPNTTPAGNARSYLMALTLEDAQGNFELPNLTGINPFPNDNAPADDQRRGGRDARGERLVHDQAADHDHRHRPVAGRLRGGADPVPHQRRHAAAYSGPFDLTPRARSGSSSARSTAPVTPRRSTASTSRSIRTRPRPSPAPTRAACSRAAGTTRRSRSRCAPATARAPAPRAPSTASTPRATTTSGCPTRAVPGRRGG